MVIACGKQLHGFNLQFKGLFFFQKKKRTFNLVCNLNLKAILQLCKQLKIFEARIVQIERKRLTQILPLKEQLVTYAISVNTVGLFLYMFLPGYRIPDNFLCLLVSVTNVDLLHYSPKMKFILSFFFFKLNSYKSHFFLY